MENSAQKKQYQVQVELADCKIVREYEEGTLFETIAKDFQKHYEHQIVLGYENYKLFELHRELNSDCSLKFITTGDEAGNQAYKRSVCLMLVKAIHSVLGKDNIEKNNMKKDKKCKVRIDFSVSKGYYCIIEREDGLNTDFILNQTFLDAVKENMLELVKQEIPIQKRFVDTDEAVQLFREYGMEDKEKLFGYRRCSLVELYRIDRFEDYYYGYMVPNTSYLKYFELYLYDEGFVVQMPEKEKPTVVPPFLPQEKLFQVLKETSKWGDMLGIETVADLNEEVTKHNIQQTILVQEALQEKKIAEIAEMIQARPSAKFILIAGPSSSGKTTFSHRLAIQLRAHGLIPHLIAVDNYFVDREKTPKDEFGNYNFECLGAIDLEAFNQDLTDLLEGKEVSLPVFDFKKGRREYPGIKMKLGEQDVLVIEGIHCLNDALTYQLKKENKFKIYISALTQLNIDEHNRIPTTDGRLIRRMIRDARTRGLNPKNTIAIWPSVRRGEEKNIFPYQEEADAMFDSALIYELAVLKQYAEPALFGIEKDCEEYMEAKRLLKFLDYFVGIGSETIPTNSILREFVGGGCFQI